MKNVSRVGMVVGVVSLFGCFAEERTAEEGPEPDVVTEALVARNPCDRVRCKEGFSCEVVKGRAYCSPSECATDADCRLEADYCGGCNCRALAEDESVPECKGDTVACFVSPCLGQVAKCVSGSCVAQKGNLE